VNAAGATGTVDLAYSDVSDNEAWITTGIAATTVSGGGSSDTLTINADLLANDTTLTLSGPSHRVVNDLQGDISATSLTGTLTVTTDDNVDDNGISIITGTANTTINGTGGNQLDLISVDAEQMADNTTLTLTDAANFTITNLEANTTATNSSGELRLAYDNITDDTASLAAGTGNITITGGNAQDTITATGLNTASQSLDGQRSDANLNVTAGGGNQTITGSNTAADTINGGSGSADTLNYASLNGSGVSAVQITLTDYASQSGTSTGQGSDQFSGIESIVGTSGSDSLTSVSGAVNEIVTISGSGDGAIALETNGRTDFALGTPTDTYPDSLATPPFAAQTNSFAPVSEDFASSSGWTNGQLWTINGNSALGIYGISTGSAALGQDVWKDFTVNGQSVTINFDLHRLDSWDGEAFQVFANDTKVFENSFTTSEITAPISGSTAGYNWSLSPYDNYNNFHNGGWNDQTLQISIVVPQTSTTLKLGFGSTLDQGFADEAYAIDNLELLPSNGFAFADLDTFTLGAGDDTFALTGSGSISGSVDGGAGSDLLNYIDYGSAVTVDLSTGEATGISAGGGTGLATSSGDSSFEAVFGSAYADTISGDDSANELRGYGGNDTINAGAGDDIIDGGDNTNGADGDDLIIAGEGADLVRGSNGDDTIYGGGSGADDSSVDVLTYADENESLVFSLTGTDEGSIAAFNGSGTFTYDPNTSLGSFGHGTGVDADWEDTASGFERWVLSNQSDIIQIDPVGDFLSDEAGSAQLDGRSGFDVLDYSTFEGDGSGILIDQGGDTPNGGSSSDRVFVNLSNAVYHFDINLSGTVTTNADLSANDNEVGEYVLEQTRTGSRFNTDGTGEGGSGAFVAGTDVVGSSNDSSIEGVIGGGADDVLVGDDDANLLVGNGGDDLIAGGAGNDSIYGGDGDDFIIPGAGADFVNGGRGINTIRVTSDDINQDTFTLDGDGVNTLDLREEAGDLTPTEINITGNFTPSELGVDVVNGGDDAPRSIQGNAANNTINLGGVTTNNISEVNGGEGSDTIGNAMVSKVITTTYDGGVDTDGTPDTDVFILNVTFDQLAAINQSGAFTRDVRSFTEDASGRTFSTPELNISAQNFELGSLNAVAPVTEYALQGDPAAFTYNTAIAVDGSTVSAGATFTLAANANAVSEATAASVGDLSSALVQADEVKGVDASSFTVGRSLTGTGTAQQSASASASTGDARTDAMLAAYGLGVDRSAFNAGEAITLSLSGTVAGTSTAASLATIADADGTVEVAGSRDSSFIAGTAVDLGVSGTGTQTVESGNVAGLSLAGAASRAYGIDDSGVADGNDRITAGSSLGLQAVASAQNTASAGTVRGDDLGTITLVDNGGPTTDRLQTPLYGDAFPFVAGDRIRFTSSGGGLLAGRDYYVVNPINNNGFNIGEFQVATTPDGPRIDITAAVPLSAYRPADATADAIALATGVDLDAGMQAGTSLTLAATAEQTVRSSAESVAGNAISGLNRLGALEGIDVLPVSEVTALDSTVLQAGSSGSVNLDTGLAGDAEATTVAGDAIAELNGQVRGSSASAATAGTDLAISSDAALDLAGVSSSVDGLARALSGAAAGATPQVGTYGVSVALADANQTAGRDLGIDAGTSVDLDARATTIGGSRLFEEVSAEDNGGSGSYLLIDNHGLGEGDRLQVSVAGTSGLSLDTDYVARLVGFGTVDFTNDTIAWGDRDGDGTADVVLANDQTIRFGLNSNGVIEASASRYGIDMGRLYYVVNAAANTFQLATTQGGAAINLTEDIVGLDDTLIDLDRIQLSASSELTAPVIALTDSAAPATALTVSRPSEAVAMAGSRKDDTTLADTSAALDTAMDWAVRGVSGGATTLQAGADANVNASTAGAVNASATNTDGDATAAAALESQAIDTITITAGAAGVVSGQARIDGTAEARTVGDSATLDDALANLNLVARGLRGSEANDDISIGDSGSITAGAVLEGRSVAAAVTAQSDALADLEATGLRLDNADITLTIGDTGSIAGSASIGAASPLLVSANSAAAGLASVQAASESGGILGTVTGGTFSTLQAGPSQGDISGSATSALDLRAIGTAGAASVDLGSTSGGATASFTTGIRDVDLFGGSAGSAVSGEARGSANLLAQSVGGDATITADTEAQGIFSASANSLEINLGGQVAAIAQQIDVAQALSIAGNATAALTSSSLGLGSADVTLNGNGSFSAEAINRLQSLARTVEGRAGA